MEKSVVYIILSFKCIKKKKMFPVRFASAKTMFKYDEENVFARTTGGHKRIRFERLIFVFCDQNRARSYFHYCIFTDVLKFYSI